MADYHGTVELLTEDGTVVAEVIASLWSQEPIGTGLVEWGGTIADVGPRLLNQVGKTLILRMPDGNEGKVLLSNLEGEGGPSGVSMSVTLHGSGDPPPF